MIAQTGHLRLLGNGAHSGQFDIGTGGVAEFEGGTQTSGGAITGGGPLPTPTGLAAVASDTGGQLATGTYFYKVAARNINGETLASGEVSVAVTGPAGKVTLSWDAVPGATSYRVYRGTASNAQNLFFTAGGNGLVDTGAGATGGSPQTVNNSHARVYFSGGTITLNGTYDVPTTWIGGGTSSFNGPTSFNELHVFGGLGAMNRPNSDVAFLSLTGGAIGGTGQLSVVGPRTSSWTGGAMHTAGTTRIAPGVTLNLSGTGVKDLHTNRLLRNDGTMVWTGTGPLRTGGNPLFENAGLFEIQTDADVNADLGAGTQIVNTGTVSKTAGVGSSNPTDISVPFDNDGTVLAQTGYLRLNSGDGPNASTGTFNIPAALDFSGATYDLGTASSMSGAGTVVFSAGQTNVNGVYDLTTTTVTGGAAAFEAVESLTDVLNLSGGTLAGSGRLTMTGPAASSWTGGAMSVGTTLVRPGVTLNLGGGTVKDIHSGRVLRNEGTMVWTGTGNIRSGNATFENTGLFEVQTDADINQDLGGTHQLVNTGTVSKTAGVGSSNPTDISVPFDNDGTALVQAGYLRLNSGDGPNASSGTFSVPAALDFSGGTHDLGAASSLSGSGSVFFTAGQTNVNGAYDLATTGVTGGVAVFDAADSLTDVLNLSTGVVAGSGRLTLQGPAPSSWTGGSMSGTGTTLVPAGVTLNLGGGNVKDIHSGRVLRNEGTAVWTGTGNMRSGNATLENTGLFDVQTDADISQDLGGTHQIFNTGTFRKSAGAASTDVAVTVNEHGRDDRGAHGNAEPERGVHQLQRNDRRPDGLGRYLVRSILRFNNADIVTNNARIVLDRLRPGFRPELARRPAQLRRQRAAGRLLDDAAGATSHERGAWAEPDQPRDPARHRDVLPERYEQRDRRAGRLGRAAHDQRQLHPEHDRAASDRGRQGRAADDRGHGFRPAPRHRHGHAGRRRGRDRPAEPGRADEPAD